MSIFLSHLHLRRQGLSQNLALVNLATQAGQGTSCPHVPRTGAADILCHTCSFHVGSVALNSGPPALIDSLWSPELLTV